MRLRPVTIEDADFLLDLKNDAEVRKWAIVTHDKIERENHIKWLENKLKENIRFFILLQGNERVGDLRVEADGEISVRVVEKHRGKGYGTKALESVAGKVYAKIVEKNLASLNLFTKNGFKFVSYEKGVYILKR